MGEQIKIEPLFGPQELFDGVPEYIEVIRFNDYSRDYLWSDLDKIKHLTFRDLKAIPIVAMRRIIKVPVWKKADQLVGKLPDVGCRVNFCHKLNTNWRTGEIKYIDDRVTVIKADDILRLFVYEIERVEFKPIEPAEEKAQREEDEFVASVIDLASENQLMSCGFKDGVIAAYRKLKGGE